MIVDHYKCIVCQKNDFEFLDINSYFFVSTLECIGCGTRQSEWVSIEAAKYYYKNHYRGEMTAEQIEFFRSEYVETAEYQISLIRNHVSHVENSLDYGGATGELADRLKLLSKSVDVTEYDPNYIKVLSNKKHNVLSDTELLNSMKKYDLITSSHVLEHFQNPYELLNTFKSIAHEGTLVYLEVPNEYRSVENRDYAKGHLTFFDIPSLHLFISNQKCFDLVKTYDIRINKYGKDCQFIGIVLRRNGCDSEINIVKQDFEKIAAMYSKKLVFCVSTLKDHQKLLQNNNIENGLKISMPMILEDD